MGARPKYRKIECIVKTDKLLIRDKTGKLKVYKKGDHVFLDQQYIDSHRFYVQEINAQPAALGDGVVEISDGDLSPYVHQMNKGESIRR